MRDAVALDDAPEAPESGKFGAPSYIKHGRAVGERPVHDVAVAGDPADVGGAPVDVVRRADRRRTSW